jgi:hypothetical protein
MFKNFQNLKIIYLRCSTFTKKCLESHIKNYNEDFIYNLFNDKKVIKYLAQTYNIDRCLLNDQYLNNVNFF